MFYLSTRKYTPQNVILILIMEVSVPNIRVVIKTLSNIYDEAFFGKTALTYFEKKLYHRSLIMSLNIFYFLFRN